MSILKVSETFLIPSIILVDKRIDFGVECM